MEKKNGLPSEVALEKKIGQVRKYGKIRGGRTIYVLSFENCKPKLPNSILMEASQSE